MLEMLDGKKTARMSVPRQMELNIDIDLGVASSCWGILVQV